MGVMTRTSSSDENRHDTLAPVTGKSGRGTARQTIRVDADLWAEFGEWCEAHGTDRSVAVRSCIAGLLAGEIELAGEPDEDAESD